MLVLSVERKNFERSFGRIVDFEGTFDVLEIRIDDQPLSEREQSLLEQLHTPFCYTLGPSLPPSALPRMPAPFLVDVPWQTSSQATNAIRQLFPSALLQGSAHDDALPLSQLFTEMQKKEFDALKIATTVQNTKETIDLLKFLAEQKGSPRLTCLPMGEPGQFGRLLAPTLGSFLSFCCLPGAPTAPGQLDIAEIHSYYHAKDLSSTTKRYALVGDPVHTSPSNRTHTNVLRHFGIDGIYVKIPLSAAEREILPLLESLGFAGLSVTAPLKKMCGTSVPINTLKWVLGKRSHTNTDAPALLEAIQEHIPLPGARVLLLGAGGVGSAALRALIAVGANVSIYNRTFERASALAKEVGGISVDDETLHNPDRYDVVVNATSAHHSSFPKKLSSLPFQQWGVHVAAEFAMSETPFLEAARRAGLRTISGEDLWARQAAKQFNWWCDIDERQVFFHLKKTLHSS